MCATCVAQGVVYVGGALGGLQVMAASAKAKRAAAKSSPPQTDEPQDSEPPEHSEATTAAR